MEVDHPEHWLESVSTKRAVAFDMTPTFYPVVFQFFLGEFVTAPEANADYFEATILLVRHLSILSSSLFEIASKPQEPYYTALQFKWRYEYILVA